MAVTSALVSNLKGSLVPLILMRVIQAFFLFPLLSRETPFWGYHCHLQSMNFPTLGTSRCSVLYVHSNGRQPLLQDICFATGVVFCRSVCIFRRFAVQYGADGFLIAVSQQLDIWTFAVDARHRGLRLPCCPH